MTQSGNNANWFVSLAIMKSLEDPQLRTNHSSEQFCLSQRIAFIHESLCFCSFFREKMGDTITFFKVISKVLFGYQEDIQGSSASLHYSSVVTPGSRVSIEDILFNRFLSLNSFMNGTHNLLFLSKLED